MSLYGTEVEDRHLDYREDGGEISAILTHPRVVNFKDPFLCYRKLVELKPQALDPDPASLFLTPPPLEGSHKHSFSSAWWQR